MLEGGGIRLFLRLLYSPDVEVQVTNAISLLTLSQFSSHSLMPASHFLHPFTHTHLTHLPLLFTHTHLHTLSSSIHSYTHLTHFPLLFTHTHPTHFPLPFTHTHPHTLSSSIHSYPPHTLPSSIHSYPPHTLSSSIHSYPPHTLPSSIHSYPPHTLSSSIHLISPPHTLSPSIHSYPPHTLPFSIHSYPPHTLTSSIHSYPPPTHLFSPSRGFLAMLCQVWRLMGHKMMLFARRGGLHLFFIFLVPRIHLFARKFGLLDFYDYFLIIFLNYFILNSVGFSFNCQSYCQ